MVAEEHHQLCRAGVSDTEADEHQYRQANRLWDRRRWPSERERRHRDGAERERYSERKDHAERHGGASGLHSHRQRFSVPRYTPGSGYRFVDDANVVS